MLCEDEFQGINGQICDCGDIRGLFAIRKLEKGNL